jgi:hypothetical protein
MFGAIALERFPGAFDPNRHPVDQPSARTFQHQSRISLSSVIGRSRMRFPVA